MDIAAAIDSVRTRIAAACQRAGRSPDEVRLLPVSKNMGVDRILAAHAAGCRLFGENRVQEARAKVAELADVTDLSWAIVGHLQTNKARQIVEFATEFHALDSWRLAVELDRHLKAAGRRLDVFVQVNSSGEETKFGLAPADVPAFAERLQSLDSLHPRGLMTLAMPSIDPRPVVACFERMQMLRRTLAGDSPLTSNYSELSMGMSDDFELAIEHGATVVRIGRGIFGER